MIPWAMRDWASGQHKRGAVWCEKKWSLMEEWGNKNHWKSIKIFIKPWIRGWLQIQSTHNTPEQKSNTPTANCVICTIIIQQWYDGYPAGGKVPRNCTSFHWETVNFQRSICANCSSDNSTQIPIHSRGDLTNKSCTNERFLPIERFELVLGQGSE